MLGRWSGENASLTQGACISVWPPQAHFIGIVSRPSCPRPAQHVRGCLKLRPPVARTSGPMTFSRSHVAATLPLRREVGPMPLGGSIFAALHMLCGAIHVRWPDNDAAALELQLS
jgi:hypothetical protein